MKATFWTCLPWNRCGIPVDLDLSRIKRIFFQRSRSRPRSNVYCCIITCTHRFTVTPPPAPAPVRALLYISPLSAVPQMSEKVFLHWNSVYGLILQKLRESFGWFYTCRFKFQNISIWIENLKRNNRHSPSTRANVVIGPGQIEQPFTFIAT